MSMRRAIVLALTAALGGCVLFIDEIETQDHCGIQGSGLCAECIRQACQEPIDKCCAASACTSSTILNETDACGRGRVDECITTLSAAKPVEDQEAVRGCIATNCNQQCSTESTGTGTGTGTTTKWTCTTARGTQKVCEACVFGKCAASITDCCSESTCQNDESIHKDIGNCVAGDENGCAYMLDDSRSTSGKAGVVRKCIQTNCAKECLGDGLPHTTCTLLEGGEYCSCSNAEKAGTQECTKALVGGDCVVGRDGCTCGTYSCEPYITSDCTCSLGAGGGEYGQECNLAMVSSSSSSGSSSSLCCVKVESGSATCRCSRYKSECDQEYDEYNTPSCDRADFLATVKNLVVSACSR